MGSRKSISSYRALLFEEFEKRQQKNGRFTIRAFARFLDIAPSTLLTVMKQQRHFQKETAIKVAAALKWSVEQHEQMLIDIGHARSKKMSNVRPQQEFYELCEWPVMAIARLALIKGTSADPSSIARRIGVPEAVAASALEYLKKAKFIKVVGGQLKPLRPTGPYYIPNPNKKAIIYQQELLKKAAESLEKIPVEFRHSLLRMIPLDERRLGQLARVIGQLAEDIEKQANPADQAGELYCLAVQFFPVSTKTAADCPTENDTAHC